MCAIAGVIRLALGAPAVNDTLLRTMAEVMAHRGPDDQGVWTAIEGGIGLSHRRLSIIDLDRRASQPMADSGGRLHIVFNGEIYNHAALRRELAGRGAHFLTDHADTEVLLEGYAAWGLDGLLARLEGMYAFGLYDAGRDTLHLVRDPIGIKPLYFSESQGRLAFASEIKALLKVPGVERRVDAAALYHYLSFMVAPAPMTMFAGIAKLPAGHVLSIGPDRRPAARRYWNASQFASRSAVDTDPRAGSFTGHAAKIRTLVEAAVEKHMVADVPVGVFLSGGVDSSTLLALMTRMSSRPVRSFTVGFRDDPTLNEIDEARDVARTFGAEHHEVLIDADTAEASLTDIVQHQDEPLADWVCVPLWHVARLTGSSNTKAILVGEGADELFLGYPSYRRFLKLAATARRLGGFVPSAAAGIAGAASCWLPADRLGLRGLADHVQRGLSEREMFWTGAIAYWETQKRAIMGPAARDRPLVAGWSAYGLRAPEIDVADSHAVIRFLHGPAAPDTSVLPQHARMQVAELALRLPELLLMRVDKMTMAHALESRVPFLDQRLVEHVLALDEQTLMQDGKLKALLKAAVAGLVPDGVLDRPKRGFAAPVVTWLRGGFGRRLADIVARSPVLDVAGIDQRIVARLFDAHIAGRKDLSLWLWPLINLALWHRHWIEGGSD